MKMRWTWGLIWSFVWRIGFLLALVGVGRIVADVLPLFWTFTVGIVVGVLLDSFIDTWGWRR